MTWDLPLPWGVVVDPFMRDRPYSKRDRIRDVAERILREEGEPLHISTLAPRVADQMGPAAPGEMIDSKTVNNSMHDDPKGRFLRVAIGTWTLKTLRR